MKRRIVGIGCDATKTFAELTKHTNSFTYILPLVSHHLLETKKKEQVKTKTRKINETVERESGFLF